MNRLLLLCSLFSVVLAVDPFIRYIHELQSPSGGFHEVGSETANLHSTADALFLTSLYGLKTQINADDAAQFVASLENPSDHGYALSTGVPSSLEATRFALLAYTHLGKPIPNSDKLSDFIRSRFDVETGLVASQAGAAGNWASTALAVESLHLLDEVKEPIVQKLLTRTKELLSQHVVGTESLRFSFETGASASPLTENYYGLLLAKKSGYQFSELSKWTKFITDLQDLDPNSPTFGGFFSTLSRNVVTAQSTAHAALSLHLLGSKIGNEEALARYTAVRKANLADSALSHLAFAHTSLFKQTFNTRVSYDSTSPSPVTNQVTEGVRLSPRVLVTVLEGQVAHGGFQVSSSAENKAWSSALTYDPARYSYVTTADFDTEGKLGDVAFEYQLSTNVYPIGAIEFTVTDAKKVGYQVNVDSTVTYSGRQVEEGESIFAGTEFVFDVALGTSSSPSFNSGDFVLDLIVLDASAVEQDRQTVDGSTNSKAITFNYALVGDDFPAGAVTFLFEIRNGNGVHTTHKLEYNLQRDMVASHITFEGADERKFKLGGNLKVSIQAGSLNSPLSAVNAAKRSFALDISSPQGQTLLSVPSVAVAGADVATYTFETTIPTTIDFIGPAVVSFRFLSDSGAFVKLRPLDSQNESDDDSSSLQITINAELHLAEVESYPSKSEVTFGTVLPFRFKIQDAVSGKYVSTGDHSLVTVVLSSGEGASYFESAVVPAEAGTDGVFDLSVTIDANAVKGPSRISLKALNVDGETVSVFGENTQSKVEYVVNVGGNIEWTSNKFDTTSADSSKTAVVLTFALSCENTALKNARLTASISTKDGPVKHHGTTLSQVPVAVDSNGRYSLSLSLEHEGLPTGDYVVQFIRDVDRRRAARESDVAPLFSIPLHHKQVESGSRWFQMELVTLIVLSGVYFAVSSQVRLFDNKKNQ